MLPSENEFIDLGVDSFFIVTTCELKLDFTYVINRESLSFAGEGSMKGDDIDFPNLRLDSINRIPPGHWKIPFPIGHRLHSIAR